MLAEMAAKLMLIILLSCLTPKNTVKVKPSIE